MRMLTKVFRATFKSWQSLFDDATDFANGLGQERVVSILHSCDSGDGVVVVWYWGEPTECRECGYDLTGNTSGRCPECGWELRIQSDDHLA